MKLCVLDQLNHVLVQYGHHIGTTVISLIQCACLFQNVSPSSISLHLLIIYLFNTQ